MNPKTNDLPAAWWLQNLDEIDLEIARLATLCRVRILDPWRDRTRAAPGRVRLRIRERAGFQEAARHDHAPLRDTSEIG